MAIEACPPIASGAGSVVTARFVTREAHLVASVQLRGPGGELETLTGTELHPIWSVDRADWIPLSQLQPGERLLCSDASTSWDGESERGQAHAFVLGVTLSTVCEPVFNLEIHGEHVYQVGELGVLVHNAGADDYDVGRNAPVRGALELGGFAKGATVDEILAINKRLGGSLLQGSPSSALAAAARQDGFFNKSAALIRSIVKNHTFTDANKRTAQEVFELLKSRNGVTTGVSAAETRRIIQQIAEGKLDDIAEIAKLLKGF
ncbi:MAG: type II toxin-antitoxin system death-on-curing family toxin [Planctomycetota bacterium]|jgi:death-on-curing family protein